MPTFNEQHTLAFLTLTLLEWGGLNTFRVFHPCNHCMTFSEDVEMSNNFMIVRNLSLRLALILFLGLFAATIAGCRTAPVKDIQRTPVPAQGASLKEVGKAIKVAGAGLGWVMKESSPGLMTGTLHLRDHMAQVEIPYSRSSYSIRYKDSSNLKYNATDKTIHSNYVGWIQNLNNAIRVQLSMI